MKRTVLLPLALLLVLISSCNKYADGPKLSLRSKAERLSNSWKIEKYMKNDSDQTVAAMNYYYNYKLSIDRSSGAYTITYRPLNLGDYTETGSWVFVQQKEAVQFTRSSPTPVDVSTWKILRLLEKELWAQVFDSNGNKIEVHLVPSA